MSRTASNIAIWIIGAGVVLLFVACVNSTMSDASGCTQHMDQYGACVVADQP
jgi:hypothetical protein